MPRARDKSTKTEKPDPPSTIGIGKIVCTRDFHCVPAREYARFYRVLTQLKQLK